MADNAIWGRDAFLAEAYAVAGDIAAARARAGGALAELETGRKRQPESSVGWTDLSPVHGLLPPEHDALQASPNDPANQAPIP